MLTVNLTRGKSGLRVPLRLPATPADIGEAHARLDTISVEAEKTHIASVVSDVSFLRHYLRDKPITSSVDYTDLNELARKVNAMDEQAIKTFDGALNGASINSFADVLRIADSLQEYIFIHGVTTEKELGRFLVDSGYKGFPESVRPYLDYHAIGAEYYAERGGAFTGSGYTLRRSAAGPLIIEQDKPVLFRVHLRTGGMRELGHDPVVLALPASDEQLRYTKSSLNIEEFAEAAVIKAECVYKPLQGYIPLQNPDVALLCKLTEQLEAIQAGDNEFKLLSVLAAEKPATLEDAAELVGKLDSYQLVQCGTEGYGREALMALCGDQEVIDIVDGFLDWDAFGSHMMEEDGVVFTEFGAVRKSEPPHFEPSMEM